MDRSSFTKGLHEGAKQMKALREFGTEGAAQHKQANVLGPGFFCTCGLTFPDIRAWQTHLDIAASRPADSPCPCKVTDGGYVYKHHTPDCPNKAEADSPKPHADTCGKTLPGGSAVSFCQDGCKCWCHAETHLDSPKPVSEEEERKAFEQFLNDEGFPSPHPRTNGGYLAKAFRDMWSGWLARARQGSQEKE
jgi:hypothetical protein